MLGMTCHVTHMVVLPDECSSKMSSALPDISGLILLWLYMDRSVNCSSGLVINVAYLVLLTQNQIKKCEWMNWNASW